MRMHECMSAECMTESREAPAPLMTHVRCDAV